METKQIMRELLNNPHIIAKNKFVLDNLDHEDYIIAVYASYLSNTGVGCLTRDALQNMMMAQQLKWIDNNSILSKKYSNNHNTLGDLPIQGVPKEHIEKKAKLSISLVTDMDYATQLTRLVMQRYDEIMDSEVPDKEEMGALVESLKLECQDKYARQLIETVFPIISDKVNQTVVLNGIRYDSTCILQYIRDCTNDYLDKMGEVNISSSEDTLNEDLLDDIGDESGSGDPIFHWNLGQDILNNLQGGHLCTLSAPEKEGKTTFAIGEMVYPTLMEGKNVKYYTGEMSKGHIVGRIVTKHIFATQSMKIDPRIVTDIIKYRTKLDRKRCKNQRDKEIAEKFLSKIDPSIIELVMSVLADLLYSGKYGRLKILHMGSDLGSRSNANGSSMSGSNADFIVEDFLQTNLNEMRKMSDDMRYDLLVLDHVNHFESRTGLELFKKIELLIQHAKLLAENSIHPCCVVAINHIKTEDNKKVKKISDSKEFKDMTFSGYGSQADIKYADLALTLISTPDQKRSGLTTLIVNVDRHFNHLVARKTNQYVLVADLGASDFESYIGSGSSAHKRPYYTKEDIEKGI